MFIGYVELGGSLGFWHTAVNSSGVPTDATGSVSFRVYGEGSLIATGTMALADPANTDGFYFGSLTIAEGSYERGKSYCIRVMDQVNGTWKTANYLFTVA